MQEDKMIEIRWHGRGGQGAVTSAELTALALIHEGKFAQAFPSFGPERRGAPVLAFNRISKSGHIRSRAAVLNPDIVIVLDSGLLDITDVTSGLKDGGYLIINTPKNIGDITSEFGGTWGLAVINATAIAREIISVPIVNTTMLGALARATSIFSLDSLLEPLEERFGARAKSNLDACYRAYEEVNIAKAVGVGVNRRTFHVETLPGWKDLLPGCPVIEPGSASQYRTGDWKSQHPVYDYEKCNKCGLCYIYCPEACIKPREDEYFTSDLFYCKGCAICCTECPKDAITMVEEKQ